MTNFKVGDVVTPRNDEELKIVTRQLYAKGRKLPSPPHFKVSEISSLGYDGSIILRYECGYHTYASRMQRVFLPINKPLEDYM